MLYLEDYLEMIEHLPQELRDRFTEMREMDLSVQNSMDSLEKRVKVLFSDAKAMKQNDRDVEYDKIRKDYYKTLEDADEKVQLANQMHDLVERYLRRLDQDLHKFKMELEADHMGITEVLEKRSLELDQPQKNNSQKENIYSFTSVRCSPYEKKRETSLPLLCMEKRIIAEKQPVAALPEPKSVPVISVPVSQATALPSSSSNVGYNLGHIGAGGNAIAAAASQAIAATQQMQQGRRTASLKASYEAINTGIHAHEFSIGKELAGAAQTAIAAIQETTKKQKKYGKSLAVANVGASVQVLQAQTPVVTSTQMSQEPTPFSYTGGVAVSTAVAATAPATSTTADLAVDLNADNPDWSFDPNEPRYCICNQVSYGDMVACDNKDCPFEWFHYNCVGVMAPPKGRWYCPQCTSSMKRRGSRKANAV
ncbi:inhibitor of growth protein 3 [Bacillus rossius redtenbacheri]|uniref:inhibitor of growth protein 3 n=1 Tax=Bacillus rossius redtenbacheri TaxID=93214 RepID=UPI002FDE0EEE